MITKTSINKGCSNVAVSVPFAIMWELISKLPYSQETTLLKTAAVVSFLCAVKLVLNYWDKLDLDDQISAQIAYNVADRIKNEQC